MKFYFIIIIVVFVAIIILLFFILYKIYRLHTKAVDELEVYEQEELLSCSPSSKTSSDGQLESFDSKDSFLSADNEGIDLTDGLVPSRQDLTPVQPHVRDLVGSNASIDSPRISSKQGSIREKPHLKLALQYDKSRLIMKILIKHIDGKLKGKNGSSESYIDVQVSAYRFRTYRNPGYRRPARAVIKRQIDFKIDIMEMKTHFLLIFLLRYDPFSRLKVDGEVCVKLSEVASEGFIDGCQIELSRELKKSKQDFTAFVLRPS